MSTPKIALTSSMSTTSTVTSIVQLLETARDEGWKAGWRAGLDARAREGNMAECGLDMTDLRGLLARVEAMTVAPADGGKLAAAFAYALTGIDADLPIMKIADEDWPRWSDTFNDARSTFRGRLDAALALVERMLPGTDLCLSRLEGQIAAEIGPPATFQYTEGKCATFALSLLAALLRALIAKSAKPEDAG